VTKVDPCKGWEPIYVSKADKLTDDTAKQILAHDMYGAKLCNWKPNEVKK
jgi:hypothetical protein